MELTPEEIKALYEQATAFEQFIRDNAGRIRNTGINIDWYNRGTNEWRWFIEDLQDAVDRAKEGG